MIEKSDRHGKTADYKMSGQLKRLEIEQLELLKTSDGHLAYVKSRLTQKKTVSTEGSYQWFFESYDELEENRQQQKITIKTRFFENFDSDKKCILEEMSKILRWVVEKVPFLGDIERFRTEICDCRKRQLKTIQKSGS